MQVSVKDLRTGSVKIMDKKFADILVKLKKHEYHTAAPQAKIEAPEIKDAPPSLEAPPKKKRGRKKKGTYETRVMIAEE